MGNCQLREMFPNFTAMILGTRLDEVTDGLFHWRTIKNLRSRGLIPEECFLKISPRKVLIIRDTFLEWVQQYVQTHK